MNYVNIFCVIRDSGKFLLNKLINSKIRNSRLEISSLEMEDLKINLLISSKCKKQP